MAMGVAWAGDVTKKDAGATGKAVPEAAAAAKMAAMKDAMTRCSVCKAFAPHMDELGPVMTMEVAKLDNGVLLIHNVTEPSKVATYQAVCKEVSTAGQASMAMTDEQAKTQLCDYCQSIRTVVKSGAQMSKGNTKTGSVMILTSADPAVQTKIAELGAKCAMMAESM
jgi:hypothetical protein